MLELVLGLDSGLELGAVVGLGLGSRLRLELRLGFETFRFDTSGRLEHLRAGKICCSSLCIDF